MLNSSLKLALTAKVRTLLRTAPTMIRMQEFFLDGVLPWPLIERIETTIVMNVLTGVEPVIAISSVHPLQRSNLIAGAWIEDDQLRIVTALRTEKGYSVHSYERDYNAITVGHMLSNIAMKGTTFIGMYHQASADIMENLEKNSKPDPLGRGLTQPQTFYPGEMFETGEVMTSIIPPGHPDHDNMPCGKEGNDELNQLIEKEGKDLMERAKQLPFQTVDLGKSIAEIGERIKRLRPNVERYLLMRDPRNHPDAPQADNPNRPSTQEIMEILTQLRERLRGRTTQSEEKLPVDKVGYLTSKLSPKLSSYLASIPPEEATLQMQKEIEEMRKLVTEIRCIPIKTMLLGEIQPILKKYVVQLHDHQLRIARLQQQRKNGRQP